MGKHYILLLCILLFLLIPPTILAPDDGNGMDDSGGGETDWSQYGEGIDSESDLLTAAENGNLKKENFKKAIENTKVGVSDLNGPAVKNNIDAIKDMDKQSELSKDQIAAVEDKSKLGDLGNYDPTAMQQAIQDEYPNAQVDPAGGMSFNEDDQLTYPALLNQRACCTILSATAIPRACSSPRKWMRLREQLDGEQWQSRYLYYTIPKLTITAPVITTANRIKGSA